MKYRNTRTGATFESDCVCTGAEWERIDAPAELEKPAEEAPKKKPAQKRTKK